MQRGIRDWMSTEKKSCKLVVADLSFFTKKESNEKLLVLYENDKVRDLSIVANEGMLLNSVHAAKVKNINKNIDTAFLEIERKSVREIVYYSLKSNKRHIFLNNKKDEIIHEGDDVLVQITKEAAKTKQASASCHIALSGVFCVLSLGTGELKFSSKIKDREFKRSFEGFLLSNTSEDFRQGINITIRTAAYTENDFLPVLEEVKRLSLKLFNLTDKSRYVSAPKELVSGENPIHRFIKAYYRELGEIICDEERLADELRGAEALRELSGISELEIKAYKDTALALYKLYSLESLLENLLSKKVWLKSGAYLVIEYTEALSVIDVNTGKNSGKKTSEETIFLTNKEAALESARQIRLRNISGIILIDFINMEDKKKREVLLDILNKEFEKDKQKAKALDFTSLDLAQITRQRLGKSLWETLNNIRR